MNEQEIRELLWLAVLVYLVIMPLLIAGGMILSMIGEAMQRRRIRRILSKSRRGPASR